MMGADFFRQCDNQLDKSAIILSSNLPHALRRHNESHRRLNPVHFSVFDDIMRSGGNVITSLLGTPPLYDGVPAPLCNNPCQYLELIHPFVRVSLVSFVREKGVSRRKTSSNRRGKGHRVSKKNRLIVSERVLESSGHEEGRGP
jgi:hypothetical protein